MRKISLIVVAVVMGTLGGAGAARADLAPRDACTSPGQPCQVAGPNYDQPGTCQTTTCMKSLPDGDGGRSITSYACNLCMQVGGGTAGAGGNSTGAAGSSGTAGAAGSSAGAAGGGGAAGTSAATGGAGGTPAGAGGAGPTPPSKSSGCAVGGGETGLGLTTLALLALVFLRRRSPIK